MEQPAPKKMWRKCEYCQEWYRHGAGHYPGQAQAKSLCPTCRRKSRGAKPVDKSAGYWRTGFD